MVSLTCIDVLFATAPRVLAQDVSVAIHSWQPF